MSWTDQLHGDSLSWLLESDDPGVRYLARRDLMDAAPQDPELADARIVAHTQGPIARILAEMQPEGYWSKPGPGYSPKYYSTVWSLILLGQLGASAALDERIRVACAYLLDHALAPAGQFSHNVAPSGTIDCLQGNLCRALMALGYDDPRLEGAFEWMARSVTGEGIAPASESQAKVRYYAYKCGPMFACGANYKQPCAWGAVKVMLAFASLAPEKRTPLIERAIQAGVDFLLDGQPAQAGYPNGGSDKPNSSWWKFGFPVFYVTDILQIVEALAELGYGKDPRLAEALDLVYNKQDGDGHWKLEYDYAGKTWVSFGQKRAPSPWVTLRALRALKLCA
ncbi:MAG: Nitrogenase subunit NifH (ATPase)-like protein [Chloroflexi bacterium]|jgi:hypothetical protein|nr:Nitrogenase subunit NifH (ATPase)-like protein [Chloroflexota bacterium]